jgi:hypothetical protein
VCTSTHPKVMWRTLCHTIANPYIVEILLREISFKSYSLQRIVESYGSWFQ